MIKLASVGRMVAGAVLVGSSLAVVNVGAAQAAIDCTQAYPDRDWDSVLITEDFVAYHTGPGGQCPVIGIRSGTANVFCSKFNELGKLWYYVQHHNTDTRGWVWSGNVVSTIGRPHTRC